MPRAREDCLALPAAGPGVAIQEARAAPAIGPHSEIDICARQQSATVGPHNARKRADQPRIYASRRHHFGPVFRQQRYQQLAFLDLLFLGRLRRRRRPAADREADCQEEFLLSRRCAHAEHMDGLAGLVLEHMRGVCRDVDCRPGADRLRLATEGKLQFAFQQGEHLLKS